jgi:hypothetical protein
MGKRTTTRIKRRIKKQNREPQEEKTKLNHGVEEECKECGRCGKGARKEIENDDKKRNNKKARKK